MYTKVTLVTVPKTPQKAFLSMLPGSPSLVKKRPFVLFPYSSQNSHTQTLIMEWISEMNLVMQMEEVTD